MRRLFLLISLLVIQNIFLLNAQTDVPEYREIWRLPSGCMPFGYPFLAEFDFDSSGDYLAAMSEIDGTCILTIWNMITGDADRRVAISEISPDGYLITMDWSSDDRLIALGRYQRAVWIYDAITGDMVYEVGTDPYPTIDWHPTENLLTIWNGYFNADTGETTQFDGLNYSFGFGGYWSPDGEMVARPAIYDIDNYLPVVSSDGELIDVYNGGQGVSWSPDSTRLASTSQIRDISTGMPITIIPAMDGIIRWHPAGNLVLSTEGNFIHFWDAETGANIYSIEADECDNVDGLEISPDGRFIAAHCVAIDQSLPIPRQEHIVVWERVN